MKLLLGIVLVLGLCPAALAAEPQRLYDAHGNYRGRIDSQGRVLGKDESRLGRIQNDGRIEGPRGQNMGRIKNGTLYAPDGANIGRVHKDGRLYDRHGAYRGRMSPEKP